jgi:hypothetical protein
MKLTDPHFKVRLPLDVKAGMQAEAERHRRSLSAEIVHVLENHLSQLAKDSTAAGGASQA